MIFLRSLQRFQLCKQTNFLRKGARQGIDPKSSAVVVDKQLEREIQKREFKQRKRCSPSINSLTAIPFESNFRLQEKGSL